MTIRIRRLLIAATATLLATAGCAALNGPKTPIGVRAISAACGKSVDTLLVMLPGAYDKADDFITHGFVDAVRERHIAADIALVDVSVAYYRNADIVARLDADVIAPAQVRGIRHVWIAGISIGGIGSLIYANEKRGVVDGLLLMAPYLGERSIAAEISASGGLAAWSPPGTIPVDDQDRRLWQWLKTLTLMQIHPQAQPSQINPRLPAVYLGYGIDDRFVASHHLLAAALPADRVFTAAGGHDWPAWSALWPVMLDAAPLPHDASCAHAAR